MTRLVALGLVGAGALALGGVPEAPGAPARPGAPVVHVISIDGIIDLGLAPFLSRVIREAEEGGAAAVLLDINTFGGRVDAAVAMRDTLLSAPLPTVAFVNQRAISAGALIALACDTLIMARGGTIGAAAPVVAGGTGPSLPADEKSVSYVRKEFRATAETKNRPPEIAEAMVDADVEIAGVIAKGKLLTLTTSEALAQGVANGTADSVEAALDAAGLPGAELRHARPTWAETFVRFLTHPMVSSLLMTVGFLGLMVEIRTPGFAIPGTVGLLSLGLFLWGHWIVRLAGWEELLLIALGVVLLALEVFVIPGTSVAGIVGIAALGAGLGMALVGAGATVPAVISALGRVAVSVLLAVAGTLALLRVLPHVPFGRRLVLQAGLPAEKGYASASDRHREWLGKSGIALSALRPAGIAEIGGLRVDVVSEGEFIEGGTAIEVTRVDGNRVVVRQLSSKQKETHA